MIVVNFKKYPQASGESAIRLAQICQKIQQETGIIIVPVPTANEIPQIADMGIDCWTQHFEPERWRPKGTLLNHSDYRLDDRGKLKEEMYLSSSRGDKICLCTMNLAETMELLAYKPNFIALEPPELIGSKTTSVAVAQPDVIGKAALDCRKANIPLLVGAGIKSADDVRVSLKQGATGILVASAVVQSENQEQKLRELAEAFK